MGKNIKGMMLFAALACGALSTGCSSTSKSSVCGDCSGYVKTACEDAYDKCKSLSNCSLKDLKKEMKDAC